MTYQIELTPTARDALAAVTDKRVQRNIYNRLLRLENDPDKQGESLVDNLEGYRSVRAANERFRIIYRIKAKERVVSVAFVGLRREGSKSDVYVLFSKLID